MPRLQTDDGPTLNVDLVAFEFSRIRTSTAEKPYICVISRPPVFPLDPLTLTNSCIIYVMLRPL